MSLRDTIAAYNMKAKETESKLQRNPFSDDYQQPQYSKDDPRYGRPEAGSKTERRGIKAGNYVMREVQFLCEMIYKFSKPNPQTGLHEIKFGPLFEIYATYSDKVVGMLLRARKYGLVAFEGEMLFQRRDDDVVITLLLPLAEIRKRMSESGDPQHCIAMKK